MNHKEHQITLWLAFFILISVLLLAWPPLLTPVGADLPPRKPPSADQPPGDDDDDKPVGAFIVLQVPSAPVGLWTVVQWHDSAGGWHDIAGWSGTLNEDSRKMWWVAAKDFDTGPFRWVVYQGQGGQLLATSEWFYLPTFAGETAKIEMSLVSSPTKTLWVSENPKGPSEDGSYIELHVRPAQAGLWTIVQWQDSAGDWHDIEGWSGTLDEGSKRVWWVAPAAFGTGPFRWTVYQSQGGQLLATSESFYLPDVAGIKLRVEVSLSQ
jgi:hypothetical protein